MTKIYVRLQVQVEDVFDFCIFLFLANFGL